MKTIILSLIIMSATLSAYGQKSKTLVVYYSRTGNTDTVAKHIQSLTGADLNVSYYGKHFSMNTFQWYGSDETVF